MRYAEAAAAVLTGKADTNAPAKAHNWASWKRVCRWWHQGAGGIVAKGRANTEAYGVFEVNLERSRAFLRIFAKEDSGGRGAGAPSKDEKELLRGCLVFAVGALDAYLSDLILEIVPQFGPRSSQLTGALTQIAKNDPGLALRVTLSAGSDKQHEFRTALGVWLEGKSFQGAEKVSNALGYVGCDLTLAALDTQTGVATAAELQRITNERHDIVHRGRKPYVKQALAEDAVQLVGNIAAAIDQDVCNLYL